MENAPGEAPKLRRCMRDLAALTALPSVWAGYKPVRVADSLAEVLIHMLGLDFVYVSLKGSPGPDDGQLVHTPQGLLAGERGREIGEALAPWLDAGPLLIPQTVPDPFSDWQVQLIAFPLGCEKECGVLLAGSGRPDFPTEEERLLLGVGVNQAAVILQRWQAEEALRQSEQRFARFMKHLPGLAWIKDSQGRYVYANDAAERAFGVSRAGLYGRTDDEVFPPVTAAQFRGHDRRALESEAGIRAIKTLEHEDGVVHHSIVSKFPIPSSDGDGVLVGGMAIDITDRLAMEEALKDADRRKDEFLATLAHELRNPLAPVRNALHLMRQTGGDGPMEAERAMAERQVVHLARLIDDLMDVARISRGKIDLHKEVVDLAAVVGLAVETSRPQIDERRHELSVSLPDRAIHLEADPTRLEQVLWNLLNNSAKYSPPGGRIDLIVEPAGSEVVLRVRDTGIGMKPEMLPRIFEMFAQVQDHREHAQGGLGIGLSLVRTLVEMHGGSIAAQSDGPGKGSEFTVRLPVLARAPDPRAPEQDHLPESSGKPPRRRILVVDDNVDAAKSLARLLARLYGQDVRLAHDGQEALTVAGEFQPQVVLLDIGLPGMSGYEVAEKLRRQPEFAGTLIVALTGWGQEEDRRRSHEAGIDNHLVKPVDPEAIRDLLAAPEWRRPSRDPAAE